MSDEFVARSRHTGSSETQVGSDDLARDVAALRQDVARLSESVALLVRSQAEEGAARVRHAVSDASSTLEDIASSFSRAGSGLACDATSRFRTLGNELTASVHRSPLTSVMMAGFVGLVIGAFRRR